MAQESQMLCDGCGEVLHGKVRGQFIDRNFVEVGGRVTLQIWDDKVRKRNYQHLTKPIVNNPNTDRQWLGENLVFCNKSGVPCFAKWIDRRYGEIQFHFQQRREQNLRELRKEELEAEEINKVKYGY